MGVEKIILTENKYLKSGHPEKIYEHVVMDKLRQTECLCRLCDRKNDIDTEGRPYASCDIAKKIYDICVEHDMTLSTTRCGATDERGELLYLPLRN
jgi:hypothetical protein